MMTWVQVLALRCITCVTLAGSSIPFESLLCLNPSLSRLEQDNVTMRCFVYRQDVCSHDSGENALLRHTLLIRIPSYAGRRGSERIVRKGRKSRGKKEKDGKGERMREGDRQAGWEDDSVNKGLATQASGPEIDPQKLDK